MRLTSHLILPNPSKAERSSNGLRTRRFSGILSFVVEIGVSDTVRSLTEVSLEYLKRHDGTMKRGFIALEVSKCFSEM